MITDLFSAVEPVWIDAPDTENAADFIPLATSVRVRRNIEGFPFPGRCSKSGLFDVAALTLGGIGRSAAWDDCDFRMIDSLDKISRQLLMETKLISPLLAKGGAGRFFMRNPDASLTCMVNEEDHFSINAFAPGLSFAETIEKLEKFDADMDLPLARDAVLGYMTADPNYVGSGMTASIMLHLPALDAIGDMGRVSAAFERDWKKLALYKLLSDQKNDSGSFYLLTNAVTLGIAKEEIVLRLTEATQSLTAKEIYARHKIKNDSGGEMADRFWRAWGLLRYARKLSFSESVNAFSLVKLGSDLGVLPHIGNAPWRRMVIGAQRYHLALKEKNILEQTDEPTVRATYFRQFIEMRSQTPQPRVSVQNKEL